MGQITVRGGVGELKIQKFPMKLFNYEFEFFKFPNLGRGCAFESRFILTIILTIFSPTIAKILPLNFPVIFHYFYYFYRSA